MTIRFEEERAVLADIVTVEEAENLLGWLQSHPGAPLDLSACTHLHAANLQVLMAANANITAWPEDAGLATWLKRALRKGNGG